ncbi:DedA family protein [Arthrobacter sp. I2-34]|uniref:DedA family protein n=1 Tax=Arthrobacter hankyongi TaxID=2904801 RepID=A0ABS9LBF8_9MICC|nr:DedA family protein [Arthrobacter hankyongi]MCG2624024.1 DedA family protein [Arthrobacter hankyongi]
MMTLLTSAARAAEAAQTADSASNLSGIAQWAVDIMEAVGAPGAGLAIALENLFPPLPSEVILPLAGFTASRGTFGLVEALVWTTLGSVVGALVLYGVGAWLGRARMRALAAKIPLVDVADVDRTEAWFGRHGSKAVFFGRMIPVFRSLISIPAGIERMPVWKFLLLTSTGSLVWNTIFVLSGYYLGENWHVVESYADVFQKIVIAVVVVAVAVWVLARIAKRRNRDKTPS